MPYQKNLLVLFCLISFLGLFGGAQLAGALGQITEPIVIESALRGQSATAVLTILNSENKEIKVNLIAEGQIAGWATFYEIGDKNMASPITQLSLPVKAYQDATVKFEVPNDAPNGVYTGLIGVATIPETADSESESSSSVSQRIDREVSITVSDKEIIALNVSVIPSSYDLAAGEPLKIRFIYDNQGNVAIKPDAQIKISRDGQTIYNAIFPYPENEEAVRPGQIKELPSPIEWPTSGQPSGKYRAEIKILVNGQTAKEEGFGFSLGVFNPASGEVSNKILAVVAAIGFGNLTLGWLIIGGLLLVVFMAFIFRKMKLSRAK